MSLFSKHIDTFVRRMNAEQLPEAVIVSFCRYYRQLWEGVTGLIPEEQIDPVTALDDVEDLPAHCKDLGEKNIARTAIIKLNGGLGTSMGMKGAKSLLPIKDSLSFMDVILRRARYLDGQMPVIFMNSFSTREDTLTEGYHVVPNPDCRIDQLRIDLDSGFYKYIDDFEQRFSAGPPSLAGCKSLQVKGDFKFGSDVILEGAVSLVNASRGPFVIEDRTRILGELRV